MYAIRSYYGHNFKVMKNIAIFGGTFNPIHNGHINIINKVNEKIAFDKIIIMPAKIPPHKNPTILANRNNFV